MQTVLSELGVMQSDLARKTGMSKAAASRLVSRNEWPKRRRAEYRCKVTEVLRSYGADALQLREVFAPAAPNEKPPESCELPEGAPNRSVPTPIDQEESMLLRNETLTQQARKHFGLVRSPFVDDIQSRDDVFQSPSLRYVRAQLLDAATNHGFIAIVGESGSGKSTLIEELEERIRDEQRPIMVIKPYVLAMEANDQRGKTLKSGQIAESILRTLAPSVQVKSSPDARFKQLHEVLKASRKAGFNHLLVIEEAHCMPIATLKHLKRFAELKDGLQRLLGIALIGQPELRTSLGEQSPEVREVVQRCELVEMPPLDSDLEAYLAHKFQRFEIKPEQIFEADVFDAIRARLIRVPRGSTGRNGVVSICYPLIVNNLVCRAMNAAAHAGYPKLDGDVIAGC